MVLGAVVAAAYGVSSLARRSRVRRGIGTHRWATDTNGILTNSDKAVLLAPIGTALVAFGWDRATRRLRRASKASQWRVPPEPGGQLATSMRQRWEQIIGVAEANPHSDEQAALRCLLNHSLRVWVFGRELARRAEHDLDEEAFHVACLGHDLGLVDRVNGAQDRACFTLLGANDIAWLGQALPDERARVTSAQEAIVHHITPGVAAKVDHLLAVYAQQGSLCDLIRQRARLVRHIDLDELCRAYPRRIQSRSERWIELGDLAGELWPLERELFPDGRAKLLNLCNCFVRIVESKPFTECPPDDDEPS